MKRSVRTVGVIAMVAVTVLAGAAPAAALTVKGEGYYATLHRWQ